MPTTQRRSIFLAAFAACLLSSPQLFAQTYTWSWGRGLNSSANEEVTGVATDNATGAIYTVGYTRGSGLIGGILGNILGNQDAFLIKYDANGTQQWAFTPGGNGDSYATGVALDATGNIYVTGWFKGTIDLNGLSSAGSGSAASSGNEDWFIASYAPDGTLRWRTKLGGSGVDIPAGISVSGGNVGVFGYITGRVSTTFGLVSNSLPNNNKNLVLLNYGLNGTGQWLISGGSNQNELPHSIAVENDRIYLAYHAQGTLMKWYGPSGAQIGSNTALDDWDQRVSAFTSAGGYQWTSPINENSDTFLGAAGLATGCGSVYLTGSTHSPSTFPGVGAINTGTHDFFYLGRLDPTTGQFIWVTTGTTTGADHTIGGTGLSVGKNGAIHVIGNFKDDVSIGNSTLISSVDKIEPYVATFRSTGLIARSEKLTSSEDSWGSCIAADVQGNLVFGGRYVSNITCSSIGLSGPGNPNGFIFKGSLASLGGSEPSYWNPPAPMCSNGASFNLSSTLSAYSNGNAVAVANSSNVNSPTGALGAVTGSYAQFNTTGGYVTLDLGITVPIGATISVLWRTTGGSATANVTVGATASPPANANGSITSSSTTAIYSDLTLTSAARYVRLTRPASGSATFEVDGVYYSYGNDMTGVWSGAGVSGSTFNPAGLSGNINVTYTVGSGSCGTFTTNAITVQAAPNAGTNGTLATCSGSPASSMFLQLGGSPQAGGSWSGPSPVSGGIYNPATMTPGTYSYMVAPTGICTGSASSTATVTVGATPSGGTFTGGGVVCPSPATGSLAISGYSGSIVRWLISTDGGGSWNPINTTSSSTTWANLTGPTQYKVELSQAGCGTGYSPVTTLTPQDNIAPTLVCPAIAPIRSAYASSTCTMTVPSFIAAYSASDNCTAAPIISQTPAPGAVVPYAVSTTVTIHATDAAGNISDLCTATIIGSDTLAPLAACPADLTLNMDPGTCAATHTVVPISYSDNCWGSSAAEKVYLASGDQSVSLGSIFDPTGWTEITNSLVQVLSVGVHSIAFVHENGIEDIGLCRRLVTVADGTTPSISCPNDMSVNTTAGLCGAVVNYAAPIGSDNCSGANTVLSSGLASGSIFPVGPSQVIYKVTDAVGLDASCSFTVTVTDNIDPSITCPGNISANTDPGICGALINYSLPAYSDNCTGVTLTLVTGPATASGSIFPKGTTTVTHLVTAANGSTTSCSFTVTVIDAEAPVIAPLVNDTLNADGTTCTTTLPDYTGLINALDNCTIDANLVVAQSPALGTPLTIGDHTVQITVADENLNSTSSSFIVRVVDISAPTVSCPLYDNFPIPLSSGCSVAFPDLRDSITVTDCSSWTNVMDPPAGTMFYRDTVLFMTMDIDDSAGNHIDNDHWIHIIDNTPPTLVCPASITAPTDPGQCSATVSYPSAVGIDNCSGAITTRTTGLASGSTFPMGVNTVTYTVTDAAGLTDSCSFTVTVTDIIPPVFNCVLSTSYTSDPGACGAFVTLPWGVDVDTLITDNCDSSPSWSQIAGPSSGFWPVDTTWVTYEAVDAGGNTAECVFSVIVVDNEAPVIDNCPAPATYNMDPGSCTFEFTYPALSATDNCAIQGYRTWVLFAGSGSAVETTGNTSETLPVGVNTITETWYDVNGQEATCEYEVTVEDQEIPQVICPNTAPVLPATAGQCTAIMPDLSGSVSYTDNCGINAASFAQDPPVGAIVSGSFTVTFSVEDVNGNPSNCSMLLNVQDNEQPVVVCPGDITIIAPPGACDAIVSFAATATDNCAVMPVITYSQDPGTAFTIGTHAITVTANDGNGNLSDCTFNITVNPTVVDLAYGVTSLCQSGAQVFPTIASPPGGVFSDANQSGTIDPVTGAFDPSGANPGFHTLGYVFAGPCTSHDWFTINVIAAPTATINYAGTPYCSNAGPASATITGTAGGTFSSTAGLSLNSATGEVNTATTTPGTYTVTYTVAASAGCSAFSTTASIRITAAPSATITYQGSPYCSSTGTASVTRTGRTGGTYSSTSGLVINGSSGLVNLSTSTPGTYTITYTVPAGDGCATFSTTTLITITPASSATIAYNASPYCNNAGSATATLTGTTGGAFSSTAGLSLNATTGTVNTVTSTPGMYTVTYALPPNGNCQAFSTNKSITITSAPNAGIAYTASPYCSNAGSASVTLTGTTGGTFSSTAGLNINGTTGAVNTTTSTAGTYTVTYSVPAAGGCAALYTNASITITSAPNATIGYNGSPYCNSAGSATATIIGTSGGAFSSTGGLSMNATTGAVNTATSSSGTYTITYSLPASGGCADFSTTTPITINAMPNAGADHSTVLCNSLSSFNLNTLLDGGVVTSGTWKKQGNITITGGIINPSVYSQGTITYWYKLTGSSPCPTDSAIIWITYQDQPEAGSNGALSVCSIGGSASLFNQLGGNADGGGSWSGPSGVVGGQYDPSTMAPGAYIYSLTATAPCVNASATVTVTETTPTSAGTDGSLTVCSNDPAQSLLANIVGFPANGGTWNGPSPVPGNMYAPSTMDPGVYTYTVNSTPPCGPSSANVTVTENAAITYYADQDSDGFGDAATSISTCSPPAGYVLNNTDLCPTDPTKVTPGSCGCGVSEVACLDCAGVPNGTAALDNCGNCAGGTTGVIPDASCSDCAGVPNGTAAIDNCGNCAGGTTGLVPDASCSDCAGVPNGTAAIDNCGNCAGGTTGVAPDASCSDCAGVPNGTAALDNCGNCAGGTTGVVPDASCSDCAGVPNGTAAIDNCGNCAGGTTGVVPDASCSDCAGVPNGTAAIDNCGNCAGGTTGLVPDASCSDCAGVPNGTAAIDNCGNCAGGTTGLIPDASCSDCAGVPNGTALPGTNCDDGQVFTINDQLNTACQCVGTAVACVVNGDCYDANPCTTDACVNNACVYTPLTTDTDGDGVPDCEDNCPLVSGVQNSPCDDGQVFTINDQINAACQCVGTAVACVVNGDCDDANPCTSDACVNNACVYTPLTTDTDGDGTPDCSDNCPTVPGQQGSACDDGNALTITDVLNTNCLCAGTPVGCVVNGDCNDNNACTSDACMNNACVHAPITTDTDGDGVPDCADNCPLVSGVQNSPCDDGQVFTINDQINAACQCVGTAVACVVNGDCNDANPCTTDACVNNACVYNPLTTDTDGDGTPDCADNCPSIYGQIGSSCNDGNIATGNDLITAGCVCAGSLLDCEGVPGGASLVGTTCDDNDALTINDTWSAGCVCLGITDIDGDSIPDTEDSCVGTFGEIGSPCDDNNEETVSDVIDANCLCTGMWEDCNGVPGGSAFPGTPCDDGDPGTDGDIYRADCTCAGDLINPCIPPVIVSSTSSGPICAGDILELSVSATGSPDMSYSWSGPGVFYPDTHGAEVSVSNALGTVYTVEVTNSCGSATGTVTVQVTPLPDAGLNTTLTVTAGTLVNLNLLLSVDSTDGSFSSPSMVVASDSTTYEFIVGNIGDCGTDTAYITVVGLHSGNAGEDGIVHLCAGSNPIDLTAFLNNADPGGTWLNGNNETVAMPVPVNGDETFTYQVDGDTASITLVISPLPEAGTSAAATVCLGDAPFNMLNLLGGQGGGSWSGPDMVINDLLDPATMQSGNYVYTVTDSCGSDVDTVTVSISPIADASWNAPAMLCANSGPIDLSNLVTGQTGGAWTGNLNGSLFDPTGLSGAFQFQYTVGSGACASAATHTITVNPGPLADAGPDDQVCSLSYTMQAVIDVVPGTWTVPTSPEGVLLSNANDPHATVSVATPGDYTLVWTVGDGQCSASDTAVITFINPGATLWVDAGPDQSLDVFTNTELDGTTSPGASVTWSILIGGGHFADASDTNTVITGLAVGQNVLMLQASFSDGCTSANDTLVITVNDIFIPQGYSPNGDGVNDQFRITGIQAFPANELKVFNRWGQEVLGRKGYADDWEGKSDNGQTLPDDTYFYVLNLTPERAYNGFVIIKR